jgi:hypothetical protein
LRTRTTTRFLAALAVLALTATACGAGGGGTPDAVDDPGAIDLPDDPGVIDAPDVPETDPGTDAPDPVDVPPDAPADAPGDEGPGDLPDDTPPDGGAIEDLPAPPERLPFAFTRPADGTPMSDAEIAAFTKKLTAFYKDVDIFGWVVRHSHGMDASNPDGMFDYALWWQDTRAIKQDGDTVTYQHYGGADNLLLRTAKVLVNAGALYLASGDPSARWVARQYAKGIAALAMGMEYGDDDPAPYLQARAVFGVDHDYLTPDGRKVRVDYGPVKVEKFDWNAATIPNPDNPHWGAIWVRNQRSKDDVPHLYRTIPMLHRLATEAPDADVRDAATLALEYVRGFADDVLASGYRIRTKFADGVAVVPTNENGTVKDLASFVEFEGIDPGGECNAKLGTALIARGEPLDLDCGDGEGTPYEELATIGHYFNYAIYRIFHVAVVANALYTGHYALARTHLAGLADRVDRILTDPDMPNHQASEWIADAAGTILAAATVGLPLTGAEARLIAQQYGDSVDHYRAYPYWNPWDPSVPDGEFRMIPSRNPDSCPTPPCAPAIREDEILFPFEYCASRWRNPAGARFVDCEILMDPDRWGE